MNRLSRHDGLPGEGGRVGSCHVQIGESWLIATHDDDLDLWHWSVVTGSASEVYLHILTLQMKRCPIE